MLTANLEPNVSGTLHEGIAVWGRQKKIRALESVKARAKQAIDWEVAQGAGFIRTHADTSDEDQLSMQALLEVKDEVSDRVDLQIVAFPQDGIHSHPGGPELFLRALDMGPDVIGGIPHNEATREAGVASLKLIFDEAEKRGLLIDTHCDEVDDPNSRFTEVMAHETYYRGMPGPGDGEPLRGHALLRQRLRLPACSAGCNGAGSTSSPTRSDNLILLAREDTYPKRRAMTRVKELWQAGITVGIGHDSIMDPWYPLGRGDMVQAASLTLHVCQMSGTAEIDACFDMVTWKNAEILCAGGLWRGPRLPRRPGGIRRRQQGGRVADQPGVHPCLQAGQAGRRDHTGEPHGDGAHGRPYAGQLSAAPRETGSNDHADL